MIVAVLPAPAPVLQGSDAETQLNSVRAVVKPAVGKVELERLRIIPEAVVVVVEGLEIARYVSEYDRAPAVAHLKRRCDVEVCLGIVHRGQIHKKRFFVRRFAILGIDLSGDGFNTVDNRGESF